MLFKKRWLKTEATTLDAEHNHITTSCKYSIYTREGSCYLERGAAGTLNLDVTPAGRVPATDRQVARQVLVSNCLVVNRCHLGLCQTNKQTKKQPGLMRLQVLLKESFSPLQLQPLTSSHTYWAAVGMEGISKVAWPSLETNSLVYTLSLVVSSALTRTLTPSAGLPSG